MSQENLYDAVLYRGFPYPQTHPDRLATLAFLFGMNSAPIDACRMLELGCGDGANLIPMAADLSGSQFVGIDLAAQSIGLGSAKIRELGLRNISLQQRDILDLSDDWGQFDYIIAHGVYSWVPHAVRDKLLAICRQNLAPHGVAFVSYNTYPGGHLRQMVRQMMLHHVRQIELPQERIDQARALLAFLAELAPQGEAYASLLKAELQFTEGRADEAIFHDDLADINQPLYFHQFVEHAAAYGLQYLSEAYLSEAGTGLNQNVAPVFEQAGLGRIGREQYLDFISGRKFRQTLLCHQAIALDSVPSPVRIRQLFIASSATPISAHPDLATAGAVEQFRVANGGVISVDLPLAKAALWHLGTIWPGTEDFSTLVTRAWTILRQRQDQYECQADEIEKFCQFLLATYGSDMVELHHQRPRYLPTVSDRPKVNALVRFDASRGATVTSQRHVPVNIGDDLARYLIMSLDGAKDRQQLVEHVMALVKANLSTSVTPAETEASPPIVIGLRELEEKLASLARLAILIG
jgi:methyltransferase-like protein/cyclopropane fatty-acyl-phospholipid synthase-like methyltransferase